MRLGVTGMNDILEARSLARRETPVAPAERLRPVGFRRAARAPRPDGGDPADHGRFSLHRCFVALRGGGGSRGLLPASRWRGAANVSHHPGAGFGRTPDWSSYRMEQERGSGCAALSQVMRA